MSECVRACASEFEACGIKQIRSMHGQLKHGQIDSLTCRSQLMELRWVPLHAHVRVCIFGDTSANMCDGSLAFTVGKVMQVWNVNPFTSTS